MSVQFLQSTINQESQTIRVNDCEVRGNLVGQGSATITGALGTTSTCSSKQYLQTGGSTFAQTTSDSTAVDASGAGSSRLFQIETFDLTLAFGETTNFHVLLPAGCLGTSPSYSNVICSTYDYSGSYSTNGTPIGWIGSIDPTQSRVLIVIKNIANSQSLAGKLKFQINIVGGS